MAFRFTLKPVLRLRASVERLERLRLLMIASMVARTREEIILLDRESQQARARTAQTLTRDGIYAAEIHFQAACQRSRTDRRLLLAKQLAEWEKRQAAQRSAYQSAVRKREIIQNLRNRRWSEYLRDEARRAQNASDELYLLRRRFKPRESSDQILP